MAPRNTRHLLDRLSRSARLLPVAALALAMPLRAHAQASVITGNQVTQATVETIDPASGEVLLRDADGGLITVDMPRSVHNLPHIQPGDRINIRFFQTIGADVVPADAPPPESTVTSAHGVTNRHPHGMMVSFRRKRVRIAAVDAAHNVVTTIGPADATQTITVHTKAMQALLPTLKVGDTVDVTTMDAVSFEVLNRIVTPSTTVHEGTGTTGASGAPTGH
ncbi:preprotein translocase subunit YajC [Gluconacetobacter tumulicola]|uniref:Preprotein translocase subunit YajC n=2 Tax=Gluconacetobacter tumulicola TaxID=1017177 RepID=A0A7W4P6Y2_9PROT|nr:preprotein translocase subunit YajC [Gluconacetobacter tumulicola]